MLLKQFLRSVSVSIGLVVSSFLWNAGLVRLTVARSTSASHEREFRYLSQHLEQWISDDSRYARIEALVDENGWTSFCLIRLQIGKLSIPFRNRVDALAENGSERRSRQWVLQPPGLRILLPRFDSL